MIPKEKPCEHHESGSLPVPPQTAFHGVVPPRLDLPAVRQGVVQHSPLGRSPRRPGMASGREGAGMTTTEDLYQQANETYVEYTRRAALASIERAGLRAVVDLALAARDDRQPARPGARGADPILSVTGLPSGHAILTPTVSGWVLRVGCWTGTIDGLRTLIAQDDGWPEAEGDQIAVRRPMLAAIADMCEVWAADRQWALDAVIEKWGQSDGGAA